MSSRTYPRQNVAALRHDPGLSESFAIADLGPIRLGKGYVDYVIGSSDDRTAALSGMDRSALTHLVKPLLASGRLPRTDHEIIVPLFNADKKIALGDPLTVQTSQGQKTYTIVGTISGYHPFARAYRWITYNDKATAGTIHIAGTFSSASRIRSRVSSLAKQAHAQGTVLFNDRALAMLGAGNNLKDNATLFSLLTLVLTVIGLAASLMIYTSINLGVQSRIQRYGLLRSIGATPKQIRQLVYREGIALAIPALGLGYLAGIGGIAGVIGLLNQNFSSHEVDFHLYFTISPWPIVGSSLFMILLTLLASARPAKRAGKISPMAAVRDNLTAPQLRHRQLRTGLVERLMPTPLSKLAAKNYRRHSGVRWTMIATLSIAIAIFIGFTSFARIVLRNAGMDLGPRADITVTQMDKTNMSKTLTDIAALPNVETSIAGQNFAFELKKPPAGFHMWDPFLNVIVVPDSIFQTQFDGKATLLNVSRREATAKSARTLTQPFPAGFTGNLSLGVIGSVTVQRTLTPQAPLLQSLAGDQGGLVLSQSRYTDLMQGKRVGNRPPVVFYITLHDADRHSAAADELKRLVPGTYVFDRIDANAKNATLMTAMQVVAYGFITLLSFVSLANIINHIFANLLQRRRELAMLQAIGTTPGQVARMLAIENGRLLLISLFWGALLGAALSWGLRQQIQGSYQVAYVLPWFEIIIVTGVLLVVWAAFSLVSYRMIRRQNIDHWLRLT